MTFGGWTAREERGRLRQVIKQGTYKEISWTRDASVLFDFVLLCLAAMRLRSLAFLLARTPRRVRRRTTVIRVDGHSDVRNCDGNIHVRWIGTCISRT